MMATCKKFFEVRLISFFRVYCIFKVKFDVVGKSVDVAIIAEETQLHTVKKGGSLWMRRESH